MAPTGTGAVVVEAGDRSRVVALGGRTGPAAARIVALVIAELLSDASDDGESDAAVDETAPAVSVSAGSNALPLPSLVTVPSTCPVASRGTAASGIASRTIGAAVAGCVSAATCGVTMIRG